MQLTHAIAVTSVLGVALLLSSPADALSVLGSAQTFAVLASSTTTNTGSTTIAGDIGVSAGTSMTGMNLVALTGNAHGGDAVAATAQTDASTAYSALSKLSPGVDLSGSDLGTVGTLSPGVYRFASSAELTGTLNLDFASAPDQAFVFEIGSTLTTASSSRVNALNGGPGSDIYWLVGSSATLGTGTVFAGNVLATASITLTTGADIICGRAIALGGAVTLDTNTISNQCGGSGSLVAGRSDFGSYGYSSEPAIGAAVPDPKSWALMLLGFAGIGGVSRVRRGRRAVAIG